jgi:hypothetical protein
MGIDWGAVSTIASAVITGVASIAATRWLENRPRLITYLGSVSTHHVVTPEFPDGFRVFTHEIIVRNTGRKSATGVRISHAELPNFHVMPQVPYRIEELPGGHKDIVIDSMVPGQQLTVSYLYVPPLIAGGVNTGLRCDQGIGQVVPVLLTRQHPAWLRRTLLAITVIGLVTVLYLLYLALAKLL